jgi:hypothetical protein
MTPEPSTKEPARRWWLAALVATIAIALAVPLVVSGELSAAILIGVGGALLFCFLGMFAYDRLDRPRGASKPRLEPERVILWIAVLAAVVVGPIVGVRMAGGPLAVGFLIGVVLAALTGVWVYVLLRQGSD